MEIHGAYEFSIEHDLLSQMDVGKNVDITNDSTIEPLH